MGWKQDKKLDFPSFENLESLPDFISIIVRKREPNFVQMVSNLFQTRQLKERYK